MRWEAHFEIMGHPAPQRMSMGPPRIAPGSRQHKPSDDLDHHLTFRPDECVLAITSAMQADPDFNLGEVNQPTLIC